MVCCVVVFHTNHIVPLLVFVGASVISSAFIGWKLFRLLSERSNYQLGYEGERFVGEELSQLIGAGFQVYHDVPFDGFNIDHVLVGARGVFVVETKTRRKPIKESGRKDYRVKFDGRSLQWPWGTDGHGVEQARNNAKTLSTWLSSATGESVWATPILTLPGWMVELTAPINGLMVLNPKQIFQVCTSQPEKLSQPQIQRICHQLNQKCRIAVS